MKHRTYVEREHGSIRGMGWMRHGFTLVELVVVIAVLAVLAAILLPTLQQAGETARITLCTVNLRQIGIAAANYAAENGRYPQNSPGRDKGGPFYVRKWVWDALVAHGAAPSIWICASCPTTIWGGPWNQACPLDYGANWLDRVDSSYVYIAEGRDLLTGDNYTSFWGSSPGPTPDRGFAYPDSACLMLSKNPSQDVMAADRVILWTWGRSYYPQAADLWEINHGLRGWEPNYWTSKQLRVQNTLFGDLHVNGERLGGKRLPALLKGGTGGAGQPVDNSKFHVGLAQYWGNMWLQPIWW